MFEPVKIGFGQVMGDFYSSLVPTTKPMHEYVSRGLSKSIAWVPARMVDAAEEMLAAWQRNDTNGAATRPAELPVILIAMAKDYVASGPDFTRQQAAPIDVIIPDDPKERIFKLRTITGDLRTQVAIVAQDEPTAKSIASQFSIFLEESPTRLFPAVYRFAGMDLEWPVQFESQDVMAMNVATESKNLTILAMDFTLKATVPLFQHPKDTDAFKDGKGTDGNPDDPHGYALLTQINQSSLAERPNANGSTQLNQRSVV